MKTTVATVLVPIAMLLFGLAHIVPNPFIDSDHIGTVFIGFIFMYIVELISYLATRSDVTHQTQYTTRLLDYVKFSNRLVIGLGLLYGVLSLSTQTDSVVSFRHSLVGIMMGVIMVIPVVFFVEKGIVRVNSNSSLYQTLSKKIPKWLLYLGYIWISFNAVIFMVTSNISLVGLLMALLLGFLFGAIMDSKWDDPITVLRNKIEFSMLFTLCMVIAATFLVTSVGVFECVLVAFSLGFFASSYLGYKKSLKELEENT